jgi:hypothetical protein
MKQTGNCKLFKILKMKNNNLKQSVPGTPAIMPGTNNSNFKPVAEEIVIFDECGDTLWDKVLAQTNIPEKPEKEIVPERQ